jgi:hypothetical protein
MDYELPLYACLHRSVKQPVEGGANIEELDEDGITRPDAGMLYGPFRDCGVPRGAWSERNAHTDGGRTVLHWRATSVILSSVKYCWRIGGEDYTKEIMTA